jgi:hypothetical protein
MAAGELCLICRRGFALQIECVFPAGKPMWPGKGENRQNAHVYPFTAFPAAHRIEKNEQLQEIPTPEARLVLMRRIAYRTVHGRTPRLNESVRSLWWKSVFERARLESSSKTSEISGSLAPEGWLFTDCDFCHRLSGMNRPGPNDTSAQRSPEARLFPVERTLTLLQFGIRAIPS